ncbi:MAG: L-threonylcarbamoyladenylate synthase [bacterium]
MSPEVRRAAEILARGGLVAFPTETVYGLGADASSAEAMARLYAVKRRPADHPVIVHFASAEPAFAWAREVPAAARKLAAAFWPGPLTLILKRSARAADYVTGGQDSVGLRVPGHPLAHALLNAFGGGIAAPSANRFGRISPTTAAHVRADLDDDVDCVLEGGASEIGIESTIIDLSAGRAVLLRPGAIDRAALEAVLGEPVLVQTAVGAGPRHPGGLERHYAPRTPVRLVAPHALDREIAQRGGALGVLAFSRPDARVRVWRRMPREAKAYAQTLYAVLRELDAAGCDGLLIETPPASPEWAAVNDRLRRACGAA